jgi:F0F1-type ATP synthase membrane subunit b/b'
MQWWVNAICAVLIGIGFFGENHQLAGMGVAGLIIWYGAKLFWGGTKMASRATSNAISTRVRDAREEKEWKRNLEREIERERELGRVRNESTIQLIEANTRALIDQAKAGKEVQRELLENYHKLDVLGDSSFNKLKSEIKGLKIMKDEDFTF